MATLNVCDICGKVISEGIESRHFKVKVKELKPDYSYYGWTNHWARIDAHNSCIEMLLKAKEINEGYGDIF